MLRVNGGAPLKFGGLFICHIMMTDIEMKVADAISGLVFQIEVHTNCWCSQVHVMVIRIINLMRKKMVYL
jgi:hypothetical protein